MPTAQKITACIVTDCKRITSEAVSCPKVPLEIRSPHIVAALADRQWWQRGTGSSTTLASTYKTLTLEVLAYSRYRRITTPARILFLEPNSYLGWSPVAEPAFDREHCLLDSFGYCVRMMVRSFAAF
jgi:hypothetical protein